MTAPQRSTSNYSGIMLHATGNGGDPPVRFPASDMTSGATAGNLTTLVSSASTSIKIDSADEPAKEGEEDPKIIKEEEIPTEPKYTHPFDRTTSMGANSLSSSKDFHQFRKLAPEIRIMIWKLAANSSRFIEFESSEAGTLDHSMFYRKYHDHSYWLSSLSRPPPVVLHINRESRRETLGLYELRDFGLPMKENVPLASTYYNPLSDILLFGKNVCVQIMLTVFRHNENRSIPRVAFRLDRNMQDCCNPKAIECLHDKEYTYRGPGNTQVRVQNFGCSGLEEVFVVVPSKLLPVELGSIDSSIGFRQAILHEIKDHDELFANKLYQEIASITIHNSLWPNWIGEGKTKPQFQFISLTPQLPATTKVEEIAVSRKVFKSLTDLNSAVLKVLRSSTGCRIEAVGERNPPWRPRYIDVVGTEEERMRLKKGIRSIEKLT